MGHHRMQSRTNQVNITGIIEAWNFLSFVQSAHYIYSTDSTMNLGNVELNPHFFILLMGTVRLDWLGDLY